MENEEEKYTIEKALVDFKYLRDIVGEIANNEIQDLEIIHDDLRTIGLLFTNFVRHLKKAEFEAPYAKIDEFPEKEIFARFIYLTVSAFYDSPDFSKRDAGLIMVDDFLTVAPFIYLKNWKNNMTYLYKVLDGHIKTIEKSIFH